MDAEVAVKYESAQYTGIIYLRNKENIYCWHKKTLWRRYALMFIIEYF